MKILINGLGEGSTINYNNMLYANGASLDMADEHAKVYIKNGLAKEIKTIADEKEVSALQNLEIKNAKIREEARKPKKGDSK